jgi:hypothetical protein
LIERHIFDLYLPEFDKPWVIHLRKTCYCSTNICTWRPNTFYKNRSVCRHHCPAPGLSRSGPCRSGGHSSGGWALLAPATLTLTASTPAALALAALVPAPLLRPPTDKLPPNFKPQVVWPTCAVPDEAGGELGWQEVREHRQLQRSKLPSSPHRERDVCVIAFRRRAHGMCGCFRARPLHCRLSWPHQMLGMPPLWPPRVRLLEALAIQSGPPLFQSDCK